MIEREWMARMTKKGYWVFTALGLVMLVALTFLPSLMQWLDRTAQTNVVLSDPHRLVAPALARTLQAHPDQFNFRLTVAQSPAPVHWNQTTVGDWTKAQHTHVIVAVSGTSPATASFTLEQYGSLDPAKLAQLRTTLVTLVMNSRMAALPAVTQTSLAAPVPFVMHQWQSGAKSLNQLLQSSLLVYYMAMLLFITLMVYGVWVAQGIIEEKSNRIVEMMLIAVKPWQILFGKVVGIGLVALVQYAIWMTGAGISLVLRNSLATVPIHSVPLSVILWFPVFFVLGYLLYATLFAIGGSLVHRPEEQQLAVTPVTMLLVVTFYASMFSIFNPTSTFAQVVSFIPLMTPLAMFARVTLSDVPAWQALIAIALTVGCIWLALIAGARIYKKFALQTSGKSGWKLLFKRNVDHSPMEAKS